MNTPNPKFDMVRENQNLKLYFFTIQSGLKPVEVPEDFKAVMAYNDEGALENMKKDYPMGYVVSVRKRGEVPLAQVINAINLSELKPAESRKIELIIPEKEKTEQEFINSMLLIADKFVIDKRDRASLKRIINKIKKHETKTDPAAGQNAA